MDWDKFLLSRFLIAIPELNFDKEFLRKARQNKVLSPEEMTAYEHVIGILGGVGDLQRRVRGKDLISRILIVAPELLSTRTVDFLRAYNLIDIQTAHALRVGLRATNRLLPGLLGRENIVQRLGSVAGSIITKDLIDILRRADQARIDRLAQLYRDSNGSRLTSEQARIIRRMERDSVALANAARGAMEAGRIGVETWKSAAGARDVWAAVTIVTQSLLSDDLLKAAIKAGAIDPKHYNLIRALESFGVDAWRKGVKAWDQDSWQARALMVSEGLLTSQSIEVLYRAGWISPELRALLKPATTVIRAITRDQMSKYQPSRKYRVIPGESPIKTFSRATSSTDRAIMALLQEAANDARKAAEKAAASAMKSGRTRAAQQRLIVKALNDQTRILWENVGYLTIFGERQAAEAALESIEFLNSKVFGKTTGSEQIRRMLESQARAGVDSYISREENTLQLSRRVYNNMSLSSGRVQREVQKALLRGVSAQELAKTVAGLIQPGVTGGVSYASLRLARTEINNAFHFTQIRYTREMPWVRGYKWNLSGSHPTPDECNTYAERDHDGLGRGVFRKASVPGKPHPNCMCYLTTVSDSTGEFERGIRSGRYDRFIQQSSRSLFDDRGSLERGDQFPARGVEAGKFSWVEPALRILNGVATADILGLL